ncbi:Cof-type HAD-IIB family hydrolase [Thermogemmatispora onikobensis]|uniref:Cof-type HAD-IIB family hydrolase n=1 Tax=Thermogemmatispora onikobensis TaxID=732234 RepID=UPI00085366DE|nr:Cof-type HAD-IIB family hydrolase [Thermogemmatispora onikobensis]
MQRYRLLAIDLDGTLLTPFPAKEVTPRARRALEIAHASGLMITITTGQMLAVLRQVCAGLPLSGPQILENGAMIVDIASGAVLSERFLPKEHILPVLEAARSLGLYRAYHTPEVVYVDRHTPRARDWYRPPLPPAIEVDDVASLYPRPCIKIAAVGLPETLPAKRQQLEHWFGEVLHVTQSTRDLLELLHPRASKGQALREVASLLGVAPAEIVAIGDHYNDVEMLRFAGLSIAMGNAPPEVQAVADYVTSDNAHDGVAQALERLVLPTLGWHSSPSAEETAAASEDPRNEEAC